MRKGMDGLAALVQTALGERPFSGDMFVFLSLIHISEPTRPY